MTIFFADASQLYVLGIVSMSLSLFAFAPYIYDILKGHTKPHRASWVIWSAVSTSSFLSQAYEGADKSLFFAGMQAAGATTIFILSISHGSGALFNRSGIIRLIGLCLALAISYLNSSAGFTLAACIMISAIAGSATVAKAYVLPGSETMLTWCALFLGAAFAFMSAGHWDPMLLVFPGYLVLLYGSVISGILLGRLREARALQGTDPALLK